MKLCRQCKNRGKKRMCKYYTGMSNYAEKCKDFEEKKRTNADRIRSMSDEELAKFLSKNTNCDCCNIQCPDKLNCPSMSSCYCRHLEWLQSEVEE